MDLKTKQIHYIETTLAANILRNEHFLDYVLQSCVVFTDSTKMDGFMSSIYKAELQLQSNKDGR